MLLMQDFNIQDIEKITGGIPLRFPTYADMAKELNLFMLNPSKYIKDIYVKDAIILALLQRCHELSIQAPTPVPNAVTPTTQTHTCKVDRDKLRPLAETILGLENKINQLEIDKITQALQQLCKDKP